MFVCDIVCFQQIVFKDKSIGPVRMKRDLFQWDKSDIAKKFSSSMTTGKAFVEVFKNHFASAEQQNAPASQPATTNSTQPATTPTSARSATTPASGSGASRVYDFSDTPSSTSTPIIHRPSSKPTEKVR